MNHSQNLRARADTLLSCLPGAPNAQWPWGVPFVQALKHGSMSVELFAPKGKDTQQPHDQDELYFVLRGTSAFLLQDETTQVRAGDVLFVPAGAPHRFENFSDDFVMWVVFYGQKGGEI